MNVGARRRGPAHRPASDDRWARDRRDAAAAARSRSSWPDPVLFIVGSACSRSAPCRTTRRRSGRGDRPDVLRRLAVLHLGRLMQYREAVDALRRRGTPAGVWVWGRATSAGSPARCSSPARCGSTGAPGTPAHQPRRGRPPTNGCGDPMRSARWPSWSPARVAWWAVRADGRAAAAATCRGGSPRPTWSARRLRHLRGRGLRRPRHRRRVARRAGPTSAPSSGDLLLRRRGAAAAADRGRPPGLGRDPLRERAVDGAGRCGSGRVDAPRAVRDCRRGRGRSGSRPERRRRGARHRLSGPSPTACSGWGPGAPVKTMRERKPASSHTVARRPPAAPVDDDMRPARSSSIVRAR